MRCGMLAGLVALTACGSSSGQPQTTAIPPGHTTTGADTAAQPPCGPAAAHTVAVTAGARIYSLRGEVYGCAHRGHGSFRLGSTGRTLREPRVGPVALAGVDAAYGQSNSGVDTSTASVIVRRLTDGRALRSQAATSRTVGPEFVQSVASIVVKADGAVAWIATANSIIHRGSSDVEVDRVDTRGRALLDSGQGIDQRSLRLHGSRLTWRDGQAMRAAPLR
jgi:hypothetical protein